MITVSSVLCYSGRVTLKGGIVVTVLGSCNRTGLRKPEISLRSSRGQDLQWQKVTQAWRKGYASLAKVLRKPGERVTQAWRKCYASLAKGLRKPGKGLRKPG